MSLEDRVIAVAVRRILTAMWVDITRVNVRVTRGVVHMSGHLVRMTASHDEFNQHNLREMDGRLRHLREVQDVKYQLNNWQRNLQGGWSTIIGTAINIETSPNPTP